MSRDYISELLTKIEECRVQIQELEKLEKILIFEVAFAHIKMLQEQGELEDTEWDQ